MPNNKSVVTTKVATLALPTREAHVVASVLPGPKGMLLFLAELNLAPQTRQEFLQNINSEIERTWQEVKLEASPADVTLESIVVAVNTFLASSERLLGNPLTPRYQLILANLSGQQIALASLGHSDAFVVSANKLTNALAATGGKKPHKPTTTFDHIVSGELMPGESLVLATPSLTDYFSLDRLRQMIADRAPGLALREIERYMLQLKVHPPLGLISLQLALTRAADGTGASMDHLLQTKTNTASLLQPKLFGYLKSKLSKPKHYAEDEIRKALPQSPSEPDEVEVHQDRVKVNLTSRFTKIIYGFRKLHWLTNRESAKTTIAWWLEGKLQLWRRLPTTKRSLLILGIIILMAFSQSIVNLGRGKLKSADSEYYNQLITQITEKQAEIEGALIYGDDMRAQTLYNEVAALLAELPKNSRSRESQWQALSQNFVHLTSRLQRLTEVNEPSVWSNLPVLETNNWNSIAFVNSKILALSESSKLLELASDGQVAATVDLPQELGKISSLVIMDKELLVTGENTNAVIYNTTTRKYSLIKLNFEITSGGFYGNNLYYLSQNNRTIWRVARQGDGFGTPTQWLRSSQGELPDAMSLTVDGSIFVATTNNVKKFTRGLEQEFSLSLVNPALSEVSSIYTANDTDYLYLWLKNGKRLVAYDKQGKLVIQLTFPKLSSISGVTIDSLAKIIYVLADKTIYRVPILSPTTTN